MLSHHGCYWRENSHRGVTRSNSSFHLIPPAGWKKGRFFTGFSLKQSKAKIHDFVLKRKYFIVWLLVSAEQLRQDAAVENNPNMDIRHNMFTFEIGLFISTLRLCHLPKLFSATLAMMNLLCFGLHRTCARQAFPFGLINLTFRRGSGGTMKFRKR